MLEMCECKCLLIFSGVLMMLCIDLNDNVERLMLASYMTCLLGSNTCYILIYTECVFIYS